jgi:hypothetical protein
VRQRYWGRQQLEAVHRIVQAVEREACQAAQAQPPRRRVTVSLWNDFMESFSSPPAE